MGIMSRKHAIKVAKYHRDHATSKELRRYWVRVINGIKSAAPRSAKAKRKSKKI